MSKIRTANSKVSFTKQIFSSLMFCLLADQREPLAHGAVAGGYVFFLLFSLSACPISAKLLCGGRACGARPQTPEPLFRGYFLSALFL